MLLLAERADQAHMADRHGVLGRQQQFFGNGQRGRNGGWQQNGRGNFGGNRQQGNGNVNMGNVSQFGNSQYKGPAPMVLGQMSDKPVCHYCGKPGHYKRECFKLQRDQAAGNGSGNRGGGSGRGGRGAGRGGGYKLNVAQGQAVHQGELAEVMRLGMAAFANKQQQQQVNTSGMNPGNAKTQQVAFNQVAKDNEG